MNISPIKIDVKNIHTEWGGELHWTDSDKYNGKMIFLKKENEISLDINLDKSIYVLNGFGELFLTTEDSVETSLPLREGISYHIAPTVLNKIKSTTDLVLLYISNV